MPTPQQIPLIMHEIEDHFAAHHIPLKVDSNKLDDGWLTVVVVPTQTGIRASDYAERMSEVERNLRAHGYDEVVLVPALED